MIDFRQLPIRLVVAAVLIVLALAIFAVVQHFSETAVEAPKPVLPPPALPAPHPSNMAQSAPAAASPVKAAPPPVETPPSPVETPPPPSVSNEPPHRVKARAIHDGHTRQVRKTVYTLQFGVFSSESNRSRMLASLRQKGLRPVTNTRVLLGPYPDREAAEKERKQLGMASVLVILPGKYMVQVGDFESIGHATHLAEKLGKQGLPVRLESRIRAGHYESRKAAMDAAVKMGISAMPVRP